MMTRRSLMTQTNHLCDGQVEYQVVCLLICMSFIDTMYTLHSQVQELIKSAKYLEIAISSRLSCNPT